MLALVLSGCGMGPDAGPLPARVAETVPPPAAPGPSRPPPAAAVPVPVRTPEVVSREIHGITMEGVAFDARSHRLAVADQPAGPGSRWVDAAGVMAGRSGLAAINAGFFTPEGAPLGKVVAGGVATGTWNRSSALGGGVWLEDAAGELSIRRRERVAGRIGMREMVQAGPLLVEDGRAVAGLEASKSSVRTVLLWDGGARWWMGRASDCTLAALGRALVDSSPAGWPVRHALNLDGGRSSDLAVAGTVPGGPLVRRSLWNRPVRNFLVLVPGG